jgi:hypothetical protein
MKERTAIEELIHVMESGPSMENGFEWRRVSRLFLKLEQNQIVQAFESGEVCTLFNNERNSLDYYNETYGK